MFMRLLLDCHPHRKKHHAKIKVEVADRLISSTSSSENMGAVLFIIRILRPYITTRNNYNLLSGISSGIFCFTQQELPVTYFGSTPPPRIPVTTMMTWTIFSRKSLLKRPLFAAGILVEVDKKINEFTRVHGNLRVPPPMPPPQKIRPY